MNPNELQDGIAFVRSVLDYAADLPEDQRSEDFDEQWTAGVEYVRDARAQLERSQRIASERDEVARAAEFAGSIRPAIEFNVNTTTSNDPRDLTTIDRSQTWDAEVVARTRTIIEDDACWRTDDHREAATRTIERLGNDNRSAEVILTSTSSAYRSAFFKAARNAEAPGTVSLTPEEQHHLSDADRLFKSTGFFQPVDAAEARALALTNVTGKLVPSHLDPSVILTNDGAVNPFRQISRVESVATNVWTGVSSAGITAGWTGAEGSEVDDDAPSFSNPAVTCYMADAFVPISFQGYEDWGRGESELERMLQDAKDRLEAAAFATGSGSNEPTGIVTALDANTNVELSQATNSAFAIADLYGVKQALPDRWKPMASWVSAEEYLDRVRQFGTSSNYHGFTVDLTAGDVAQVLGKRWYQSSAMTADLNTSTNNAIVFGDFSQYLIADRIGMVVEFVPNLFHTGANRPSGQRGWLAHWRTGADSLVDTAFILSQNPST